ncbi:MAG: hypothetical protein K6G33_13255 [Ruminococcus sp.]|uniref:hypothetical protein n=1 Tax=Ruminococcus sp. TaxID=41978 RepID=UPI0025E710AD|nr:hypothetical protein [Ruminococcus sp.]MCR5601697.1 hypothetical protein [Ruminococcus sp.]
MDGKKSKSSKTSRYSNSMIYYKMLSCKASTYEDRVITEYCVKNRLSKSIFLTAAAMYCVKNNIDHHELLKSTVTSENFDYREYMNDDFDE